MGQMSQKLEIPQRDSPHHQDPDHPYDLGGIFRAKRASEYTDVFSHKN